MYGTILYGDGQPRPKRILSDVPSKGTRTGSTSGLASDGTESSEEMASKISIYNSRTYVS
jgi:hypothetical protein